jgi:hypothetical protein
MSSANPSTYLKLPGKLIKPIVAVKAWPIGIMLVFARFIMMLNALLTVILQVPADTADDTETVLGGTLVDTIGVDYVTPSPM